MDPSDDANAGTTGTPPALIRAVQHLLRPLVRVFLAQQITYPVLLRLLKSVYLEVAEEELRKEGGKRTASRLSLLTGVHRKDIRRLSEPPDSYAPPPTISLGARLVARWTGAAEFRAPDGSPLALSRQADPEGGPSFESLVASVSTDIRPRAVLDEWQRLGVVQSDAQGRVRLVADAFVPSRGFDEKAHYFGRNLHDHIAAGAHNLSGGEPPMLERSVYYDGLSAESVEELAALSEQTGRQALQTVNRRAMQLQERDAQSGSARLRMAFGAWFFRAQVEPERGDDGGEDD